MTYAALQLRDNELLDVMYEARKLAITTVSRGKEREMRWLIYANIQADDSR